MSKEVIVYLAGPTIFMPDPYEIANRKKAILKKYKMVGTFPYDNEVIPDGSMPPADFGFHIGDADYAMQDEATTIIADLTPFRSISADSGTFGECLYMYAQGKMINGYSNDIRGFGTRMRDFYNHDTYQDEKGYERAKVDDMYIEEFELFDNLMLPTAIKRSGGLFRVNKVPENEYYSNIDIFDEVAREVAIKFGLIERLQTHDVMYPSPLNIG